MPAYTEPASHTQVPDELTQNLLAKAGADCSDLRTVRLVSLAAQKFIDDVIEEAKSVQSVRSQAPITQQKDQGFILRDKDRRAVLLTEDLTKALQQYGINLQRPPYLKDKP
jgi:transcription initiation factor TFIID subunit 10